MAVEVRQLAVGGFDKNFSYLLRDIESAETVLVDPSGDISVLRGALEEYPSVVPKYILLTHCHHDHCDGVGAAGRFFKAPVAAHPSCGLPHDIDLADGQRLPFGDLWIECIYAPGHSPDGVLYRVSDDSALFTGDTLFIDWCGYCDPETMFETMRRVIYPLPDGLEVYPGHDYGRFPHAPLGDQKKENPYLAITSFDEFRRELRKL